MQNLRRLPGLLLAVALAAAALGQPLPVRAAAYIPTAYDLISAVNGLRAARGLPALQVDAALMAAAQAHTDYQAAIGQSTHTGAGGTSPTDRARAAGYGGGKRIVVSENVASFTDNLENMLSLVIYAAWADNVHLNTMINPNLRQAGAGVASAGGMVYFTLDTGWMEGQPWISPTATASGTPPTRTPPSTPIPYVPIRTSTPLADGSLYHVVGYGQVLLSIAQAYGVQATQIAGLNRITPDRIYAGQKLLIRPSYTATRPGALKATATTPPSPSGAPGLAAAAAAIPSQPGQTPGGRGVSSPTAPAPAPSATPRPAPSAPPDLARPGILIAVACGLAAVILVTLLTRRKPAG